jgi:hypothetical protein
MGNGSGVYGLNSRIYTNSYAFQSYRTSFPKPIGNSFAGFSKPMYSSQTYHTLANNGPAADARVARFNRSQGTPSFSFIPPTNVFQV